MQLVESNRVDDFLKKSSKRYFATISGFVDKSFFTDSESSYDEARHKRYNERNDKSLLTYLKRYGLEYQKVTGMWEGGEEKSYLVYNTAYSWEDFRKIILKLGELCTQWALCIGRVVGNRYYIEYWETSSLTNISYEHTETFHTVSIADVLAQFKTVLLRKIHDEKGNIDPAKTRDSIVFEELQRNVCLAASESLMGAYKRRALLNELQILRNQRAYLSRGER